MLARFTPLQHRRCRTPATLRSPLRLGETWPITGGLRLSSEQRTQLAFLLRHKDTDNLPAQLRHAHSPCFSNTPESGDHRSGRMKLHRELTTRTILGCRTRPHDDRTVHGELVSLDIPTHRNYLTTRERAVRRTVQRCTSLTLKSAHGSVGPWAHGRVGPENHHAVPEPLANRP